ncbi:MAG: anti-sigma factor, partial [bacterium]|nr:anti-sigma factor [Candidatus Kapabacteria bacterium]
AQEIREIRAALSQLDHAHQRAPRAELRASIMDAIESDAVAVSKRSTSEAALRPGSVHPLPESKRASSMRYPMAASWVIVALSVGAATYFGMKWRSASIEVDELRQENERMASDLGVIAARAQNTQRTLAVVRSPESRVVTMNGTAHAPHAHAVVFWNPKSHELHLAANSLPQPPRGKQYQLWAIKGEAKIDAGMFSADGSADQLQRLKDIADADAFAVTLEPEGGSPTPSLDAMYALGKL